MTQRLRFTRSLAVLRLRRQLEEDSYPRIQMGFIVSLTGAAGWLCSFLFLHAGVGNMALRYPLALAGAYLVFLFLLWLWLRTRAEDFADLPADLIDIVPSPGSGGISAGIHSGGGGDFGGGGASGTFDGAGGAMPVADMGPLSSDGDIGGGGMLPDFSLDLDELAIPIIAVVLALGLALASLYVVYLAPALFAELLFDGVLSYTLYRRLRHADSSHWVMTALRKTVLPFALTALFLVAVGAALAWFAPGTHTLGEALRLALSAH